MKYLLMALLLFSSSVLAAETIDAEHPYIKIGTRNDNEFTIFIGAYGNFAPHKLEDGVVAFQEILVTNVARNGYPLGYTVEMVTLVSCDMQLYKSVTIATRRSPKEETINMFPKESYEDSFRKALHEAKLKPIIPSSLRAISADAACNYVANQQRKINPDPKVEYGL